MISPRCVPFLLSSALVLSLAACGGAGGTAGGTAHTFLYVDQPGGFVNGDPNNFVLTQITGYDVDAGTGALTLMNGSPFPSPTTLAVHGEQRFIATPDGHFLYLGACTDLLATGKADCTIAEFAVGTDGRLSHSATQTVSGTDDMLIVPSGKFMYVFDSQILRVQLLGFGVGPDGRLTQLPPIAPPTPGPIARIAVTPSGKFLYAAIYAQVPGCAVGRALCTNVLLMAYASDQNTGALTPVPGSPFPTTLVVGNSTPGDFAMIMDSQSRFIYITSGDGPPNVGFAIEPTTGALNVLPAPTPSIQTTGGASSADGKLLFLGVGLVSPSGGPGIEAFSTGGSGRLTPVGSPLLLQTLGLAGGGPVLLDPTGRFLYFIGAAFKSNGSTWEVSIGSDGALGSQAQSFSIPGPMGGETLLMVTRTP